MGIVEGINGLKDIISELDKRFRYAVEVRDSSWFQDLAYNFLQIIICVWSRVTIDFLNLGVRNRTIQEKDLEGHQNQIQHINNR